jgi:acyl carrier protein
MGAGHGTDDGSGVSSGPAERVESMQTREEVIEQIKASLVELFEIAPEQITLEARLNEDLEIDSIDAVDLLDRLRRQTGRKISADEFRSVRTVGDLVNAVHALVQA